MSREELRLCKMLVAIVLVFLLANSPIFAYHSVTSLRRYVLADKLAAWSQLCLLCNPLLNALVYVVFVPSYRQSLHFRHFLAPCLKRTYHVTSKKSLLTGVSTGIGTGHKDSHVTSRSNSGGKKWVLVFWIK
jgi:hypothetical protein